MKRALWFHLFIIHAMSVAMEHAATAEVSNRVHSLQTAAVSSVSITQTVERIELIDYLIPKSGEPQADPHASAIINLGPEAGPLLLDKLLDERNSKYASGFQYKIGDVAHALLCEIYRQDPSQALMARQPPIYLEERYTFRDYLALVGRRDGRLELQAAWSRIVQGTGAAVPQRPELAIEDFMSWLHQLRPQPFKETLSADDLYRLKRAAKDLSRPGDSWPSILQLWAAGEHEFVELLWWQKDDSETRAFIVSLEWCMVALPAKAPQPWPKGITNYEQMAQRFDNGERARRLQETDFVRQNRKALARSLSSILSASNPKVAEKYRTIAERP